MAYKIIEKEYLNNSLVVQKCILIPDIIFWPVKLTNINLRQPEAGDRTIKWTLLFTVGESINWCEYFRK